MVTPADAGQQFGLNEQDNTLVPEDDPRGQFGEVTSNSCGPCDIQMNELEQAEEEEEEEEEFEYVGNVDMSGGHEDQTTSHNVVNEQLGFGNEREVDHRYQSSKSTNTILPNKPTSYLKAHNPSSDSHMAFRMSPYPRSPSSIVSTSSTSSAPTTGSWHYAAAQDVSQSSAMKEKSTLAQIKTDIAMPKNKHKSMKMQAFIHEKEITHLETENKKDYLEAEKIHCHMMETKQLDIQVLKGKSEVLCLKLELAKIQSGASISSANVNKSSDHPLPEN
ncbi:hypothetical protein EDC04DRAFT_2891823 [Pisolithus marmoratus]|nr:hypothetical protein EDC04DRAFT_2891823 [Pisolithus marmoratus]